MLTDAAATRSGEANNQGRQGRRHRRHRGGFTLIETALATIIVGVGVLAMVSAQAAFHRQNAFSTHATTAMALANEVREMTWNLAQRDPVTGDAFWGPEANETWVGDFDDLDDFDGSAGNGWVFDADLDNGPINARREVIGNMDGWAQTIRVFNVNPFNNTERWADGTSNIMEVEVVVTYRAPNDTVPIEMTRISWVAPN